MGKTKPKKADHIALHRLTTDLQYRRDELQEYTENLLVALNGPPPPNPMQDPLKTLAAVEETLAVSLEATLPLARVERTLGPVLAAIVQADEGAFDVALRAALSEHKAYWGKSDRDSDDRAVIALGALALTCFAFDRGLRARVSSDYLVPHLIERVSAAPLVGPR